MNKIDALFLKHQWLGLLVIALMVIVAFVVIVKVLPEALNWRVESFALITAAIMMGWAAWGSRGLAKSSREQIEEMVRPSLSLIPTDYLLSGDFATLLLQNTGGLAKEVRIDIEMTNSPEKQLLFVPAIDKDHVVRLSIGVMEIKKNNGVVRVNVELLDCHGRNSTEELSVDFGKLKEEGRKLAFEESPVLTALDRMTT